MTYEEIIREIIKLGRESESAITGLPSELNTCAEAFAALKMEVELGRKNRNNFVNLRARLRNLMLDFEDE